MNVGMSEKRKKRRKGERNERIKNKREWSTVQSRLCYILKILLIQI